jgi:hypothetical protein
MLMSSLGVLILALDAARYGETKTSGTHVITGSGRQTISKKGKNDELRAGRESFPETGK